MKCPHCLVEVNPNFREGYIGKYDNNMHYSTFHMKCPNDNCQKPIIILGKSSVYHTHTCSI